MLRVSRVSLEVGDAHVVGGRKRTRIVVCYWYRRTPDKIKSKSEASVA